MVSEGKSRRIPVRKLLKFEVDVDSVGTVGGQGGRRRVNLLDPPGRRQNGFVHQRIAAGFYDFRMRDRPILVDPDFYRADERFFLIENGSRLVPLTEEPVVDELVIPGKLRRIAARAGL